MPNQICVPEDYLAILDTIAKHFVLSHDGPDGCCAGDCCEYPNSTPPLTLKPSDDFLCLCCGGKMHGDRTCGEYISSIMEMQSRFLWCYLPNKFLQKFSDALNELVGENHNGEPVQSERVFEKIEDEIICHKCYSDYIKVLQAHPPKNPQAAYSDCSALLSDDFAGLRFEEALADTGEEGDDEEEAGAEQGEVEEQLLQPHQRPPWHHLNDWRDLHVFELHELDARQWLSHDDAGVYGPKVWPMILIVMCIGIPQIGDSEFISFSLSISNDN